jgi:rsbT co-antagonist protein RsbR
MSLISNVAEYLKINAESLAVEIVGDVLHRMKLEIPEWEKEQAIFMYIEFFRFLGESITCEEGSVPQELLAWSKKNGEQEANSGRNISEIIVRYPPTRMAFTEMLTKIGHEYKLSIDEFSLITKRINQMLDISIDATVLAFESLRDKIEKERKKEMAELSAPIVPIQDGIAVLPLIGSIDSYRASYILEKVVPRIAELHIEHLIADFSGILTIDTAIAQYLFKVQSVLSLLGINTIVTGLRPDVAQTVVSGGIDMSSIKTYANLKQALESIK